MIQSRFNRFSVLMHVIAGVSALTLAINSSASSFGEGFVSRNASDAFQLRVMCWNVKINSIFAPEGKRRESYRRIVRAIDPDVICLQEVYGRSEGELQQLMDACLPLAGGGNWHAHTATDNAVLSRYPLRQREREMPVPHPFPDLPGFRYGQAMCLVDLPDDQCARDLYVVAMHNKSNGGEQNVRMRQRQSDSIVRWWREVRARSEKMARSEKEALGNKEARGGARGAAAETPLIIAGDMNVLAVEPADPTQHLLTLLTGNIVDEATFGADCVPDWDDTNLVEVKPRHNGREKEFYTWREDKTPFPPGALDRILYTDSVLVVDHAYVLNTTNMTKEELADNGLQKPDVLFGGEVGNFDHLPLVADFSLRRRDASKE